MLDTELLPITAVKDRGRFCSGWQKNQAERVERNVRGMINVRVNLIRYSFIKKESRDEKGQHRSPHL